MAKVKRKSSQKKVKILPVSNRFQCLTEETCPPEVLTYQESIIPKGFFKVGRKTMSKKVGKINNKRIRPGNSFNLFGEGHIRSRRDASASLTMFSIQNKFKLLEDNEEEELSGIIRVSKIKRSPKKRLKKCRHCNFKKRSCNLDESNCTALKRNCFLCNKKRHFPKSLSCKYQRNLSRNKKQKQHNQNKGLDHKMRILVQERINQLESKNFKNNDDAMKVPNDLVPYVMMYIFLNYEFIFFLINPIFNIL